MMECCKKCGKDYIQAGLLTRIPMLEGWYCEPCLTTSNRLTADEARVLAVSQGYRIQHKYYTDNEYLKWEGAWITEDGYEHPYPFNPPFHEGWNAILNTPQVS